MTFKHTLALTALAFTLSAGIAVAATLPGNVTNVQAQVGNNGMTVQWSPVSGATAYRVYFSHESILDNGGNYDDFEQTPDAQTTYVFKSAPLTSTKIYVAVLAVDSAGNESEGFETEASVDVLSASSSLSSSVATVSSSTKSPQASSRANPSMPSGQNPTSTAVPMGIESVRVLTETGILVTFTKQLDPRSNVEAGDFLITTTSGDVLPIEKVQMSGASVTLTTQKHAPDTQYVLGLLSVITAADGTNATPTEPQVRFRTPVRTGQTQVSETTYGRNPRLPNPPVIVTLPPPPTPTKENLPDSGLGLLGIVMAAGAGAGTHLRRRKRQMV